MVKNLPSTQETQVYPKVRKIPWRREWLPTLVFLHGESHGQNLEGYSPGNLRESGMTERAHAHTHTHTHTHRSFSGLGFILRECCGWFDLLFRLLKLSTNQQ